MKVIETGLPVLKVPLEWVVMGEGGILFTSHVAIHENGEFELGDARAQTELIFVNLKMALRAAGADLSNLLQVLHAGLVSCRHTGEHPEYRGESTLGPSSCYRAAGVMPCLT